MLLLLFLLIFGRRRTPDVVIVFLAMLEIGLANTVIALNGAASNPFSSILLVPLSLSLMLLTFKAGFAVLIMSIIGQSLQLTFPVARHQSEMMQDHAHGMVLSFILTSLLITVVIFYFRLQLVAKTAAIQQLRERQLRDEQLLGIGTAAAQLTHDAATPVQTIRLILEEIAETNNNSLLIELESQFSHLEDLLKNWRDTADEVREARTCEFSPSELFKAIRHLLLLARPEACVKWPSICDSVGKILGDRTLIPALANMVINACDGATGQKVDIRVDSTLQKYFITISNPISDARHFPKEFLGSKFIKSNSGFGVGAVLSNATIEKCGGRVNWEMAGDTVFTDIELPLIALEEGQND